MSVAIKMAQAQLITYKDELTLISEKIEAMKRRKKVLDDFKACAHARAQKNDAAKAVDVFTDANAEAKAKAKAKRKAKRKAKKIAKAIVRAARKLSK